MSLLLLSVISFVTYCVDSVGGHGRLLDPPGRSTMWRFGFNTPPNYDDNALYCGGFDRQWNRNNGRCGVCGDPYDGVRENEAGGKYAKGVTAKTFRRGQTISVTVELTRSHMGWFEFRLCPNNDPRRRVTQRCLDLNLLRLTDGTTRYQVKSWTRRIHKVTLRLPQHVTCTQCVLQWKYNAGNSWGCYGRNTHCCVGCGHQEQFYGCSDVAISGSSNSGWQQTSGSFTGYNNNNNNNNNIGLYRSTARPTVGFNLFQRAPSGSGRNSANGGSFGRSSFLSLFRKN